MEICESILRRKWRWIPAITPLEYQRGYNDPICELINPEFAASTLHFNVKRYSKEFKGFKEKDLSPSDQPLVYLP